MLEDDLFPSLHSCREPYNQLVIYCTCFPMRKQQEIAPLHADFNCFREKPPPGLTHWMWHAVAKPHLLSGSANGRQGGTQSRVPIQRQAIIQHIQGLNMVSSAWAQSSPWLPCLWRGLSAREGEKAQHHALLQGRLCLYVHRGDAGRAVLQLPPVTHHTFRGGTECQGKDPGNHKPKQKN